jgi:hypothetical protein
MDIAVDRLLALAARPALDSTGRAVFASALAGFGDWDRLVARAEAHGLAPLLRAHLRAVGVSLPGPGAATLIGLAAYHRRRAAAQETALGDALDALGPAGVSPLLLKGAALARLIYPDPALRPMGDIDLLVAPDEIDRAGVVLAERGFVAPPQPHSRAAAKHRVFTRESNGVTVNVELHFRLESPNGKAESDPRTEWSRFDASARPLVIGGRTARALGPTDGLRHLVRHLRAHVDVFTPLRLVWICDIVAFAERFVEEIDWAAFRQADPDVVRVLGLLDVVSPLAAAARERVGLGPARAGEWADFRGWPRRSFAGLRPAETARLGRDTLWPDDWWLRLHHDLGRGDSLLAHRLIHHPREMLGWGLAFRRERGTATMPHWESDHAANTR